MGLRKKILRSWMYRFSRINNVNPTWAGYSEAREAQSDEEKIAAYLKISESRYKETQVYPLDDLFRQDLKPFLTDKEVLEIGCNHGGASLAYLQMYQLKKLTGIDVKDNLIDISNRFFENNNIPQSQYHFVKATAEELPFEDHSFDALLSYDVFEHVRDVPGALAESYRVLRPGGKLFLAFPSYYQPVAHHLSIVTKAPCIHWFYSPETLMETYWDILDENPEYRDRMNQKRRPLYDYEKLYIINGTTLKQFRAHILKQPWANREFIPLPLGAFGKVVNKHRFLKPLQYVFALGARIPVVDEAFNHRIVYILTR